MNRRSLLLTAACLACCPVRRVGARADAPALAMGLVAQAEARPRRPASPLDEPATDGGLAAARLALAEANGTGRFTGQFFRLVVAEDGATEAACRLVTQEGARFLVASLPAEALRQVAAALPPEVLVLNAAAPDDSLREAGCRANLLHTAPSRAMLADALAQYLVRKRWTRWFLVVGQGEGDALYADAVRRAAARFGAEIVTEKPWRLRFGEGRADTGHVALETEIPAFTRAGVRDHDVLVVADEAGAFGDWLEGRTDRPRPVAGTQGLVATAWSPVAEAWGGTQLQSRFRAAASGRRMSSLDYTCWLAVRAVTEAAIRARSQDPEVIAAFLRGPDFLLAAFKGQGLSFRDWDGQMRQPILIAGPRVLVSVSPQPGFLHRVTPLDTLGRDRPESGCRPS